MNKLLQKDINSVLEIYPKLSFSKSNEINLLVGEIDIFDNDDNYCDSFLIELHISKNYPKEFPRLYEVGGKIPKIDDRHINERGDCCVCIIHERELREKRGITIEAYIKEYAIPFFANQIYFENNPDKEWANGEYKHGIEGILQYYEELFSCNGVYKVLAEIEKAFSINIKHYDKCFCGSGKKYKKCHRPIHFKLKSFSSKRINTDYNLLTYYRDNLKV